jgi:hypothetical protein
MHSTVKVFPGFALNSNSTIAKLLSRANNLELFSPGSQSA